MEVHTDDDVIEKNEPCENDADLLLFVLLFVNTTCPSCVIND